MKLRRSWKVWGIVFVTAVALNYPWEMLQSNLYRMDPGGTPAWLHCFRASLGDGLLVLFILVGGAGILGGLDWFRRPGLRGYAWMLASGSSSRSPSNGRRCTFWAAGPTNR